MADGRDGSFLAAGARPYRDAMTVATELLKEMADHVSYEADQLRGCMWLITHNRFDISRGDVERYVANALLESAMVHARSLDDFFRYERRPESHDDDVFARDFDDGWGVCSILTPTERDLVNKR